LVQEKISSEHSAKVICKIEIPYKFPSFNEYVNECRKNRFAGAKMKRRVQDDIGYFINRLPEFKDPVGIHFHWIEENKRRDLDNVCYAKKFILDSLVELHKLKDDNRRYVQEFSDTFGYGKQCKVILEIMEVNDER